MADQKQVLYSILPWWNPFTTSTTQRLVQLKWLTMCRVLLITYINMEGMLHISAHDSMVL